MRQVYFLGSKGCPNRPMPRAQTERGCRFDSLSRYATKDVLKAVKKQLGDERGQEDGGGAAGGQDGSVKSGGAVRAALSRARLDL